MRLGVRSGKLPGVHLVGGLDRFDLAVLICIGALLGGIGLVILSGDQVGISVRQFSPQGIASNRPVIRIAFDETLDPGSVETHFETSPEMPGQLTVNNNQIRFQPTEALRVGETYTVTVRAGVRASTGRALLQDQRWQFRIRPPRIVYLGPVDTIIQNLHMVDPATPGEQRQLTFSEQGVISFDIAPDGSRIVYSELQGQGTASLFLWDEQSGRTSLLLECKDARCLGPVWRPDGNAVAFERQELNLSTGMAPGAPRIWLYDLAQGAARPLFTENQRLGYMPRWSPDGTRLASYDANIGGIVIYDFLSDTDTVIETPQGEVGEFSPDGRWIFFPRILFTQDNRYVAHYVLVDLASERQVQRDVLPDGDPNNDVEAAWHADSSGLFVVRRTPDATGAAGAQLYSLDLETGEATPLVIDTAYTNGSLSLSPAGDQIAIQRFAIGRPGARPEIWTYSLTSGELKQVVVNGAFPRWMP